MNTESGPVVTEKQGESPAPTGTWSTGRKIVTLGAAVCAILGLMLVYKVTSNECFNSSSIQMTRLGPLVSMTKSAYDGPITIRVVDAQTQVPIPGAVAMARGVSYQVFVFLPVHAGERTDYEVLLRADSEGVIRLTRRQMCPSKVYLNIWAPGYGPASAGYRMGGQSGGISHKWETGPPQMKIGAHPPGLRPLYIPLPSASDPSTLPVPLYRADWDTRVWRAAMRSLSPGFVMLHTDEDATHPWFKEMLAQETVRRKRAEERQATE